MSNGANISSLDALKDLITCLESFSLRQREVLEELKRPIARRVEQLEGRHYAWKRELDRRQEEYDGADEDDDLGYLAMQVEEAEEQLRQLGIWQSRVDESRERFVRLAKSLGEGPDQRALAFLRERVKELEEYLAIKIGMPGGAPSFLPGREVLSNVVDAAGALVESSYAGITEWNLPKGFEWVELSAIREREIAELPADDDFRKVPKTEMQRGFEVLRNEVLPAVSRHGADSEYFHELDRKAGRDDEHGFGRVYDAFFGSEPITLDRDLDGKSLNVTSGRHRIKVARELGLPVVPAKLIG